MKKLTLTASLMLISAVSVFGQTWNSSGSENFITQVTAWIVTIGAAIAEVLLIRGAVNVLRKFTDDVDDQQKKAATRQLTYYLGGIIGIIFVLIVARDLGWTVNFGSN